MRLLSLLALWALAGCGEGNGPYQAFLLLEGQDGQRHEFPLGGRDSYEGCAELAAYEATSHERDGFWANPGLSHGGFRGGDDWALYRVTGITCRFVPRSA